MIMEQKKSLDVKYVVSILITLLFILASVSIIGVEVPRFPNLPLREIKDWEQYCEPIMRIVADGLRYKLDPGIPAPEIRTERNMTPEEWGYLIWMDLPEDSRPKGPYVGPTCNSYLIKANILYVVTDCYLHSVAHEYAHYFQFKYGNHEVGDYCDDPRETEAVNIQYWFANTYLGGLKRR